MTLSVAAYRQTQDGRVGERIPVDAASGCNDLIGVEVCRTLLWGSGIMRSIGCTMLPSLAEGDIWATGDELKSLEHEAHTIIQNLGRVCREAGFDEGSIRFRLGNLLAAVRAAAEHGGAVWIS